MKKRRKPRKGEVVCRCGAYRFPHREMGGDCDGSVFVEKFFEAQIYDECRDCHLREESEDGCLISCQALEGRETLMRCPGLEDHVRYHGIKLYGVNRPT